MRPHIFRLVPFGATGPHIDNISAARNLDIAGTVELDGAMLNVAYRISGAPEQVKAVSTNPQPARKNDLWRTTCFELFMKATSASEYWEVNLAPSCDWNVYRFTGYRSALQPELQIDDIKITPEVSQSHLTGLRATLPVPPPLLGRPFAVGISCVIEDIEGKLHYFALRHDGVKPDFHNPAGFVLSFDSATA
ncbi:MAG: DOMON-like domain-containing protein [Gammaproteobacteria bacterium]|nr:DOMON-like domain-containing protein [Gammaproteobacteria bacterium]